MSRKTILLAVAAATLWSACASVATLAQTAVPEDVRTRQLWDDAFRQKRQATARDGSSAKRARATALRAEPATAPDLANALVGVTLWRVRPVRPSDLTRGAVVFTAFGERVTAERVEVGTSLAPGERLRLSIEAARTGYLYLLNRERYADQRVGDPYLLFPRLRIRGGDNRVTAGRLVEIPDLADTPPYFTLASSAAEHIGDLITVIVSPQPLPDIPIGRDPVKLDSARVAEWQAKWGTSVEKIELPGGAGVLYTQAERDAGQIPTRLLTQEEPVPQTMYRVGAGPTQPFLVNVTLAVKKGE